MRSMVMIAEELAPQSSILTRQELFKLSRKCAAGLWNTSHYPAASC